MQRELDEQYNDFGHHFDHFAPVLIIRLASANELLTRLGVLYVGTCEGGALPVIMSITGPRETHDYRELTL